jgi:predicted Zn finger-like uncharacterized protein
MQLACPACHTAFHIEAAALGVNGRSVRCTRCRNTWFARPSDLVPTPAMAEVHDEPEAIFPDEPQEAAAPILPEVVAWNDMVIVDVQDGPSLAPGVPSETAVPVVQPSFGAPTHLAEAVRGRRRPIKSGRQETRLGLVALLLGVIVVIGVTAREPLVQTFPGLAGYYSLIGLPVNLRGLEFRDLRTSFETQDGAQVLIIEGEIVNSTRQSREIPRLRLSVMSEDRQEIYAWTAQLPRGSLGAREILTFRSRLASPPEKGSEVMVRFLHRTDLAEAGR